MESAEAWYNVLAILLAIATRVLNLGVMKKKEMTSQDHSPLTESQYQILKTKAKDHHLPLKNSEDALMVIAKMGGHIINKSYPPGWLVLSRGYEKLLFMAMGYELAIHKKTLDRPSS